MKRIFDSACATALLLLFSPLLLVAASLRPVYLESTHPFQTEWGYKSGVEHQLYKFRTMVADAEENTGSVLAREFDPRITALGRVSGGGRSVSSAYDLKAHLSSIVQR